MNQTTVEAEFEKKVVICDKMEEAVEANGGSEAETESETCCSSKIAVLLRRFLALQQRRAQAYARLKRYRMCVSYVLLRV